MKKLLNTLFVTHEDAYLSKEGENVVIRADKITLGRFPIHILESILCFSYVGMSPALMKLCNEHHVLVSFLTPQGRFCARLVGVENGNVLLRRQQYRLADKEAAIEYVRNIVYAKGLNSKRVLARTLRDNAKDVDTARIQVIMQEIDSALERIKNAGSIDSLRGEEGLVAKHYFDVFDEMILQQRKDFYFLGRNRRPPQDPVNALLSFFYTLLCQDCMSGLEAVGLDPYVGFLHADRPGRVSLALDLMEELRAFICDRAVLSMINLKMISMKDFELKENGAVLLNERSRNKALEYWQKQKQIEITHPFLQEKIQRGLLPYVQAMLMSRTIRGDLESYPPFVMRA